MFHCGKKYILVKYSSIVIKLSRYVKMKLTDLYLLTYKISYYLHLHLCI